MTQQILLIGLNVCWQITALALVALGLAIVFGLLRILNMAVSYTHLTLPTKA